MVKYIRKLIIKFIDKYKIVVHIICSIYKGDNFMDKKIIWGITGAIVVVVVGAAAGVLAVNSSYRNTHTLQVTQLKDDEHKEEVKLNGWKEEQGSWYFYKNNDKQKNWIEDENSWYYLGSDGKMRTGWIKDKDQWYYLNNDGTMATNVTIDGCYLNDDGIIEETPAPAPTKTNSNTKSSNNSQTSSSSGYAVTSFDQAEQIIRKNDSVYLQNQNPSNAYYMRLARISNEYQTFSSWSIPAGEYFEFELLIEDEGCNGYFVSKSNGDIYTVPHQGSCSAYQIRNNRIIQKLPYLDSSEPSYDWR